MNKAIPTTQKIHCYNSVAEKIKVLFLDFVFTIVWYVDYSKNFSIKIISPSYDTLICKVVQKTFNKFFDRRKWKNRNLLKNLLFDIVKEWTKIVLQIDRLFVRAKKKHPCNFFSQSKKRSEIFQFRATDNSKLIFNVR